MSSLEARTRTKFERAAIARLPAKPFYYPPRPCWTYRDRMSNVINHDRTHMTGIPAGKGAAGKVVEVDAAPAGTTAVAKFRLGTCVMDNGMTVT